MKSTSHRDFFSQNSFLGIGFSRGVQTPRFCSGAGWEISRVFEGSFSGVNWYGVRRVADIDRGLVASLLKRLDALNRHLERINVSEYIQLIQAPRRLIWVNFMAGAARGFGIAVGFTAMGAIFVYVLGRIASLNLPVIGEFIAQLVRIVEQQL